MSSITVISLPFLLTYCITWYLQVKCTYEILPFHVHPPRTRPPVAYLNKLRAKYTQTKVCTETQYMQLFRSLTIHAKSVRMYCCWCITEWDGRCDAQEVTSVWLETLS